MQRSVVFVLATAFCCVSSGNAECPGQFPPEGYSCFTLTGPANCVMATFPVQLEWLNDGCWTPFKLQVAGNPPSDENSRIFTIETDPINTTAWVTPLTPEMLQGLSSVDGWYQWRVGNAGEYNWSESRALRFEDPAKPSNDAFDAAIELTGSQVSVSGSNANATKEPGEPNHAENTGGRSVWWRWTAPASGSAQINTMGSSFDTTLGVYTGTTVSALTTVADNDDAEGTRQSSVSFPMTSGTTYWIAVDGYDGVSGSISVTIKASSSSRSSSSRLLIYLRTILGATAP